jgi:hypothetical protein
MKANMSPAALRCHTSHAPPPPHSTPHDKPCPFRNHTANKQPVAHALCAAAAPPPPPADQFQLLRQQLFCNSDFWPCGPYGFDDEEGEGGWGGGGAGADDGWVHYDTSNWKPPAAATAAAAPKTE